ncbi:uncharacterized protein LOC135493685 [Lineus longissimus]|uniref:uncharacterized protein LOC135493685 n=1 Tax=Lineus longissimus TaxID=88925 RepID=UPI002B4EC97F
MGAKTSRQGGNSNGQSKASTHGRKLKDGPRLRSTSMPDMPNAMEDAVNFSPNGKDTREKLAKRTSHDHVLVTRQRTPPPDYHRNPDEIRRGYTTTTDQMVKIWPSYQYLGQFDLSDIDMEIVEKITLVFRHLLDQRDLIQTLSADNKRINGMLREYKGDQAGQRLSLPPMAKTKLDRRDSGDAPPNRTTTLPGNRQSDLMRKDPTLDPKLKLMAEVQKMRDQALISSSKRKSLEPQTSFEEQGPSSPSRQRREEQRQIEELTAKVKSLQGELDNEKRKRLSSAPTSSERSPPQEAPKEEPRNQICLRIKMEYARLDKFMMMDVKAELDSAHKGLDDKTKYQFMCAAMQDCRSTCQGYRERLGKSLKSLLLHPTNGNTETPETEPTAKRTSVLQNISKFETAAQMKKKTNPDRQYIEENKLPSGLLRDVMKFVASISEHIDFSPIIQDVTDHLKNTYPTILTDSLCANTNMKKYITDCCKIAWNMCIIDPPMRLVSTPKTEFNEEFHLPFRSKRMAHAKVDYFLWPVLFDDLEKPSVVVGKGRVALLKS